MCLPTERSEWRIMLLGEGPGESEDSIGRQFVGKTGQYLRNYLPGEWINKVYWNNVVRCRPTSEDGRSNRAPTDREVKCCSVHLNKDILDLRPHVVLAIGDPALNFFWPDAPPISKIRGIPFPAQVGDHVFWVSSTFHPSYVTRAEREEWGSGQVVNPVLPVFKNDLKNFFARTNEWLIPPQIQLPPKKIIYPKSYEEAVTLFNQLEDPWSFDYETTKLKPYHRDARLLTGACSDRKLTFAFPIDWPGDLNPWGKKFLLYIMSSGREWIAQHANFELIWTWAKTKQFNQNFHDTEALARLIHKRTGLGSLDVLSRIYFGIDIKELTNRSLAGQMLGPLDKSRLSEYSVEQVLEYNALDAWAECLLFHQLVSFLPPDQFENYVRIIETIKSTTAMELYGLPVDRTKSEVYQKQLLTKTRGYESAARALPEVRKFELDERKPFSLSKPETVAHVIVKYYGIELEQTDKHNYSVDEEVLDKLVETCPLAKLRLDFVGNQKLKSTYVDPILNGSILGVDGLIHGAYKVIHTKTYRLSSESPNMQNWPSRKSAEIRSQLIPPPGYIFLSFDYGQLEARVLAMLSKDPELKRSIISNEDIHSYWLNRCIQEYPQYIERLAVKTGETDEKEILIAGRTIIKTDFVFASFYGSIAKSIANRTGIPYDICVELLKEFWARYRVTKDWIDGQHRKYAATGVVQSLQNRIRNEVLPGNEIINTPVQGSAAELVLEAQNVLCTMANDDFCLLPRVSIHDSLDFFVPDKDDKIEYYTKTISCEMIKPRFNYITTPLMVETKFGPNWGLMEKIGKFVGQWYEKDQLVSA